jgi:eukaryotic-like serine/threonine-protein kinase
MLTDGTILQSRYRIVRQLGQGGMGAVYEAVDERLDTTVALKETFFADEKLRKQFEREARLLARMHHPALPRVSDHFNENDGQFLVMQYVAGQDLSEMLAARNTPFPEDQVAGWADQLCDALDYLHTQDPQIIHRDIKPQNLKLTSRGQVVLLDFGLAKGSVGQLTAVTTSASIFGYTPNYAPLEQIQGKGTDPRSDIYALGATLYHLVTNVKPPDALSRAAAVVNGQDDPLTPANQVTAEVGAGLSNVLSKAMSQKRDDRFATASEMRAALQAADYQLSDEETLVTSGALAFNAAPTFASEKGTRLAGAQTRRTTSPSFSSEAQTLVAGEATNVRTVTGGQAALAQPARRTNWLPIAAAAIVLILIAGGSAAFIAYRRSHQPQTITTTPAQTESQPVQPSQGADNSAPVTESRNAEEATRTNQSKTEKPRNEAQRGTQPKPDQKPEDAFKNSPTPEVFDPAHQGDPGRNRDRTPAPGQQPNFDPLRPVPPDRRHPAVPEIRVLPNGGRMIKNPDGTTVWIGPNGKTRVITPGEKGNRTRNGNDNRP